MTVLRCGHVSLVYKCTRVIDQRNMGMSMKVERSTVEQVRARFEMHKRKSQEKKEVREYGRVEEVD